MTEYRSWNISNVGSGSSQPLSGSATLVLLHETELFAWHHVKKVNRYVHKTILNVCIFVHFAVFTGFFALHNVAIYFVIFYIFKSFLLVFVWQVGFMKSNICEILQIKAFLAWKRSFPLNNFLFIPNNSKIFRFK